MKIIEALKQVKDLGRKADDIVNKIMRHAADLDYETPTYADQRRQIDEWIQSHSDVLKEMSRLKFCIQRTNVLSPVTIEIGGKQVTKSITEWIFRRKTLCTAELQAWKSLNDRGLKEGAIAQSNGVPLNVKIRRYFDPQTRDRKMEELQSEPALIDARLEVINAVTDLLE